MLEFTKAIEEYKFCLKSDKMSENTIRAHISAIKRFYNWCQLEHIEDITARLMMEYKSYLVENGSGGVSANIYMSYLRSFFTRLKEDELINKDIAKFCRNYKTGIAKNELGKRQKTYQGEVKKFISKENRKKIFETAATLKFGQRDLLLVESALRCGLRESEVINLRPCDIKEGFMTILNSKHNKTRTFFILDKNYLNSLLIYIKVNAIPENDYIFKSKSGKKMNTKDFENVFKNILKVAGIPAGRESGGFTCHDLRGTFITCLFDAGMTAEDIAEIVGHSNIRQTMEYRRKNNSEEKLNRYKSIYKEAKI